MARRPYRIARQEHVGDFLDDLQRRGRLTWRWEYDSANSRAIFHVHRTGETSEALHTREAESLAHAEAEALGIRWKPVPHPGGEAQRAIVVVWIGEG